MHRLPVNAHDKKMMEGIPNIIRPVKKKIKKYLPKKVERNIFSKLHVENIEVIVDKDHGFRYSKREITLQNNFKSFVELNIVEGCRNFTFIIGKGSKKIIHKLDCFDNSQGFIDIGFIVDDKDK